MLNKYNKFFLELLNRVRDDLQLQVTDLCVKKYQHNYLTFIIRGEKYKINLDSEQNILLSSENKQKIFILYKNYFYNFSLKFVLNALSDVLFYYKKEEV